MKNRCCDILLNDSIVGQVYYCFFEFDSYQVRLLDSDKNVISSFFGSPKFLESENLYLSGINIF